MAIMTTPFPDLSGKKTVEQKVDTLLDNYYMLRKEIEYGMQNIGVENFDKNFNRYIEDSIGNVSELILSAELFTVRISDIEGNVSTIIQTADDITLRIEHTEEAVEEIGQKIPYKVDIISTNGVVFKSGEGIVTTLIARVYRGDEDVTDSLNAALFRWKRVSEDAAGDEAWNTSHFGGMKQIVVTIEDVLRRATFFCELLKGE